MGEGSRVTLFEYNDFNSTMVRLWVCPFSAAGSHKQISIPLWFDYGSIVGPLQGSNQISIPLWFDYGDERHLE